MKRTYAIRRTIAVGILLVLIAVGVASHPDFYQQQPASTVPAGHATGEAVQVLEGLAVKGRAPKTGYTRAQFGDGWESKAGCDTRNIILRRDLADAVFNAKCQVTSGTLSDPYTGKMIAFVRGETSSQAVQIDHVVALSDAWQKGAQQLSFEMREALANDPLELLAVDGAANQQKSDGDAATWLPANKSFRCQYVARQLAVKKKYTLWVTQSEKDAMINVLRTCPGQTLPADFGSQLSLR